MNVAHLDRCQDWIDLEHTEPPMRLYLVYDVPEDTVFQTRTRKEISNIAWHPLKKLPGWGKGLVSKGRYWYVAAVVK